LSEAEHVRIYRADPSLPPVLVINSAGVEHVFKLNWNLLLKILSEAAQVARWMK